MAKKKSFTEEVHGHFRKLLPVYATVAQRDPTPDSAHAYMGLLDAALNLDRHVVEMFIATKYGVSASQIMGMPVPGECEGNCAECTH
jgi:hypothetical protein